MTGTGGADSPAEPGLDPVGEYLEKNQAPARTIRIAGTRNMVVMEALANEYCESHADVNVEFTVINQSDLSEEILTLAASNDLPDLFMLDQVYTLIGSGDVIPVDSFLGADESDSRLMENVREGIIRLYQNNQNNHLYCLPSEQNIEGFWYNKKIFEENHWPVPDSMEDFMRICGMAKEKGIQPIALSGENGFYLSRLWGGYINALLGTQALEKASDGIIRWDDPALLPAYAWFQEMYEKGYFGKQVINLSEDGMYEMLLSGDAAMVYSGSWIIRTLNVQDTGESFGFFGFPVPSGGKGSSLNYCQNYGIPWMVSIKNCDETLENFLEYVTENYGNKALELQRSLSGYRISSDTELPYYTMMVKERIENAGEPAVWPEYHMGAGQTNASYRLSEQLLLGELTPEEFGRALEALRE